MDSNMLLDADLSFRREPRYLTRQTQTIARNAQCGRPFVARVEPKPIRDPMRCPEMVLGVVTRRIDNDLVESQ